MLESVVEKRLRTRIEAAGGFCMKFVSPQNSGVPDRVACLNGLVVFIETKAPGKTPRPLQKQVITEMRQTGALVAVVPDIETVDRFMDWFISAAPKQLPKQPKDTAAGFCKFKNIVPRDASGNNLKKKPPRSKHG